MKQTAQQMMIFRNGHIFVFSLSARANFSRLQKRVGAMACDESLPNRHFYWADAAAVLQWARRILSPNQGGELVFNNQSGILREVFQTSTPVRIERDRIEQAHKAAQVLRQIGRANIPVSREEAEGAWNLVFDAITSILDQVLRLPGPVVMIDRELYVALRTAIGDVANMAVPRVPHVKIMTEQQVQRLFSSTHCAGEVF